MEIKSKRIAGTYWFRLPKAYNPAPTSAAECAHVVNGRVYIWAGDHTHSKAYVWLRVGSLLTMAESSPKLVKSNRVFSETASSIHYGAPHTVAAFEFARINQCSHATDCAKVCLNTAGRGRTSSVALSRICRTRFEFLLPALFAAQYRAELSCFVNRCDRRGVLPYHRPDGTTDRLPPWLREIVRDFPRVTFYGYTANPNRDRISADLPNYSTVFSRKETARNHQHCAQVWARGVSLSVVVSEDVKKSVLGGHYARCRSITHNGARVRFMDYDIHDIRHPDFDGAQHVGLLTPKGKAVKDQSGFVIQSAWDLARFVDSLGGR